MPALPSSAARMPPAAPPPTMTTSVFSVAMAHALRLPAVIRGLGPRVCLVFANSKCSLRERTDCRAEARQSRGRAESLEQRSRILLVAIGDRVGAHIGERLNGERRIKAAHRREARTADDEEVRNIPALAVAVHYRRLGIAAHARAALVVRARRTRGADRSTPHDRRAHRATDLLHLVLHELDARTFVRTPPVVGHARRRQ